MAKKIVEILKTREEQLKLYARIIDETKEAIYLADADTGNILFANNTACKELKYTKEEIVFYNVEDISVFPDNFNWKEYINNIRKKGNMIILNWHRCKDNATYPVELGLSLVYEGGKEYLLSSARNISERLQAAEKLKLSEMKYRSLFETMAEGVIIKDESGLIKSINPAVERILGYSISQLNEKTTFDPEGRAIHEDGTPLSEDEFPSVIALKTGKSVQDVVIGFFNPHIKQIRWLLVNAIPHFRTNSSNPYQVFITLNDITDRKEKENEMQKSQKMESLRILAGGIAHDFNNLLTGIFGYIELAQQSCLPDSKISHYLNQSLKAFYRAKELTKQLLTFSKGGEPIKKVMNIKQVIVDAAMLSLSGSSISYEIEIPPGIWLVEIDEGQINQVLNNILLNARHASPDGEKIEIKVINRYINNNYGLPVDEGKFIEIAVTDYGAGIDEEDIPKIFDPFFTTKKHGSGLGLAISYSIIKKHQGHIAVESQKNKGTTFRMYLPVATKVLSKRKESTDKILSGSGQILIVDDEEIILEMAREILLTLGYKVDTAATGEEAIIKYKEACQTEKNIDLVILDLTIAGGMGGEKTVKELKKINPHLKAIASSGYSEDPVMSNPDKYGFIDVVFKPFRIKELSKIVYNVLNE